MMTTSPGRSVRAEHVPDIGSEDLGIGRSLDGHAGASNRPGEWRAEHRRGIPMAVGSYWRGHAGPLGARPHRRVRFVLAPDSSRKISRAGSKPAWRRRHSRRARAMSGRSCSLARSVFFYMSGPSSPGRSGWRAACSPGRRRPGVLSRSGPASGPGKSASGLVDLEHDRLATGPMVPRTDITGQSALLQEFLYHAQRDAVALGHVKACTLLLVVGGQNPFTQVQGQGSHERNLPQHPTCGYTFI